MDKSDFAHNKRKKKNWKLYCTIGLSLVEGAQLTQIYHAIPERRKEPIVYGICILKCQTDFLRTFKKQFINRLLSTSGR